MKTAETAVDDRIVSTQEVEVVTDTRGHTLSHYVLAERLLQCEYHLIKSEIQNERSSETVIYMLEGGFRGFHNMSPGELYSEWNTKEELFWDLYDNKNLPWELYDEDPLA